MNTMFLELEHNASKGPVLQQVQDVFMDRDKEVSWRDNLIGWS